MNDIQSKIITRISGYMKGSKYKEALLELLVYRRAFLPEQKEKVRFLRGYLSLKAGDPERARKIFEKLSVDAPEKSLYYYFLGVSNLELANYKLSLINFQEALKIVPENREYLKNYAWALVMNHRKKGLSILEDLYKECPDDKDLALKYILALLKFEKAELARWIAELSYRKFQEEEFFEILSSIRDPETIDGFFLTENEEKVLLLIDLRSGLAPEIIDETQVLFLALKDRVFKRIYKPEPWAAALEIAARVLHSDEPVDKKVITRKYGVNGTQVDRILRKVFVGGLIGG
ncbi:MAG: hypothetical protein WBI42_01145 [Candidatus Hydrothermia bacterium]